MLPLSMITVPQRFLYRFLQQHPSPLQDPRMIFLGHVDLGLQQEMFGIILIVATRITFKLLSHQSRVR